MPKFSKHARVMKLANIIDSKSIAARLAGSSPASGTKKGRGYYRSPKISDDLALRAYVVGLAIGDGNLSSFPRTTRLRISCDTTYPKLISNIKNALLDLLPDNKVTIISKGKAKCVDVSCYSKYFEELLGWSSKKGPKHIQKVRIPDWIKSDKILIVNCLRGLFETDGSIYVDRGYKMVNFVTVIKNLAEDVMKALKDLGFIAKIYKISQIAPKQTRYNIRISKDVEKFIKQVGIKKE